MFIKDNEHGEFIITSDNVYKNSIELGEGIFLKYIESVNQGKSYKLVDINGETFEEIFEEIIPISIVEIPSLENRVLSLGEELAQEKLKNIQKDSTISQLGQELASLKLEVINLKGGN